jgi:hypothetical protein
MLLKINEELQLVRHRDMSKAFWVSVFINFILGLGLIYFSQLPEKIKYIIHTKVVNTESVADVVLSDSGITAELTKSGAVLAAMACAQSKIESNHGKSNVGKAAKNLFGITYHKCNFVADKHGVYAKYNTYRDCIKCYIHIQNRYLKKIDGSYASDPSYVQTLKSIK